jgi:hypothetical protein
MFHRYRAFKPISLILFLALFSSINTYAQSDTEPPKLVSMTISPSTVDVTSADQTVTVTMHLTDNLSGLDTTSGRGIGISFISPSGSQTASGIPPRLIGTVLDSTLVINLVVQRYVEPGTWTAFMRLADNTGNTIFLDFAALTAAGFPASINVIDPTPDTEAPQLAAVSLSPSSFDVSSGDSLVTVDLTLTDNLAGVGWSSITFQDFELRSPSGQQSRFLASPQFQLISGTPTNGIWHATINMPRYSEAGPWICLQFDYKM